jgi:HSP20 family protein
MTRSGSWRRELSTPLQALQGELNRLFEEYWTPTGLGATASAPMDLVPSAWNPRIDVYETPEGFVLLADLPGVEPSTIDLSVTGNVLTLRGEKATSELPEGHAQVHEREAGTFHRQVTLSSEVNFDSVQAESRNGVLKVSLPKQEAAKPRTIPIVPS